VAAPAPVTGVGRIITLVCTAHFFSHFYMLLPPPLPLMREDFEVGFTELGFAVTVFSLTTGLVQAPAGLAVDRHGARWILIAGLMVRALALATVLTVLMTGQSTGSHARTLG
jgi:MFS family permease